MGGRYVIAEGTESNGLAWVIWARRHEPREGDLLSVIRITDATGRILHGVGRAGPPLPPGRVLDVTSDGSEEGPRALLARVAPSVRRLELKVQDGTTLDVPLYDCPEIPEVRFASLLLPRDVILESVAGFGAKDKELERFDLRFYQGRWEERHAPAQAGLRH
ncbi:MAG TPA: hypothetical protein VLW44_13250 [Streptosporangiaceae bacterium]|nr:hypothetical protein [Streptosporangiaceae bacterium]